MKFTKMQGIGNDYVYVNCFEETVADPERVSEIISDRHFGIGADAGERIERRRVAAACEVPAECVHRKNDGVLFLLRSGCDGAPAGRGASGEQECKQYTGVSFHFGVFLFA